MRQRVEKLESYNRGSITAAETGNKLMTRKDSRLGEAGEPRACRATPEIEPGELYIVIG